MKKKLKVLSRRALACFLSVMLCVSMLQLTAFAADETPAPEGGTAEPTPVAPDPVESTGDPVDVDVKVEFTEDGAKVEVGDRPEAAPDSTVDYSGTIKDGEGEAAKTPEGDDAQLTGSETNTQGPAVTDPENPDRVTEESTEVKNEETTDPIVIPTEDPEPEEETEIIEGILPDGEIKVETTPEAKPGEDQKDPILGEGETKFPADTGAIKDEELEKLDQSLTVPEDMKEKEGDENKGIYEKVTEEENKTTTNTWQKVPVENGYQTIETETVVKVETGPAPALEAPASDPEKGITVETTADGGYIVTTVTTDENGLEITQVKTVTNGIMTTTTTTVTTTKKTHTVEVNQEDGSVKVTVTVEENKKPDSIHGELETESDRAPDYSGNAYQITVADNDTLNVRDGIGTSGTKVVDTLSADDIVYVFEEKDGWGRIGDNRWISLASLKYAKPATSYKVDTGALNIRNDAGTSGTKVVGMLQDNSIVYVTETKKVGSTLWGKIGKDQWISLSLAAQAYEVNNKNGDTVSVRNTANGTVASSLANGTVVYVTKTEVRNGKTWGKIGENQWILLDGTLKSAASTFDPKDGMVDTLTDLFGWEDKLNLSGRPNDANNTSGVLYETKEKQPLYYWDEKAQTVKVFDRLTEAGLIFVDTDKEIDKNDEKYGFVGYSPWGTKLYVKLSEVDQLKAEKDEFLFYGEHGLSSSIGVNLTGSDSSWYNVHQFVIKDSQGKDHYVYCSDLSVRPKDGVEYGMENVEDVDFLKEYAGQISAIAGNGYWGASEGDGSMESFKDWLKEIGYVEDTKDLSWLTPGLAMTATQASIWHYSTSGTTKVDEADPFVNAYKNGGVSEADLEKLRELYAYLTSDDQAVTEKIIGTKLDASDLIQQEDVKDVAVTVRPTETMDKTETYEADISFVLKVEPGTKDHDMTVKVVGSDGKEYGYYSLLGTAKDAHGKIDKKDDTYTIKVEGLPGNVTLDLQIQGTQEVKKGAYLITAQGGYKESQTFISVEEGTRTYDLNVTLDLNIQAATATVTTKTETDISKTQQSSSSWGHTESTKYSYKDPEKPKDPEEPKDPEPVLPDDPEDDDDGPEDPTPPPTPVPRTPETPDTPTTVYIEIPDGLVPLAGFPVTQEDLIEIFDDDVPLAGLPGEPGTGIVSHTILWTMIFAASLAGLLLLSHKDQEDAA